MVLEAQAVSSGMDLKKRREVLLCRDRTLDARTTRVPDEKARRVVVSLTKDMMRPEESLES